MRFEWSEEKDRSNLRKHEISFATATRVFEDPNYVMVVQDREVEGEERWQTIGRPDWRYDRAAGSAYGCG
ncbi:MAG: BrnT family toxin [Edaphobacter sp.]